MPAGWTDWWLGWVLLYYWSLVGEYWWCSGWFWSPAAEPSCPGPCTNHARLWCFSLLTRTWHWTLASKAEVWKQTREYREHWILWLQDRSWSKMVYKMFGSNEKQKSPSQFPGAQVDAFIFLGLSDQILGNTEEKQHSGSLNQQMCCIFCLICASNYLQVISCQAPWLTDLDEWNLHQTDGWIKDWTGLKRDHCQ